MKIKFSSTNSLFMFTLFFCSAISFAQPPQTIRVGTVSIENYSASPCAQTNNQPNLSGSHDIAESFVSYMRSKMQQYYPGVSVQIYWPYKDQEATSTNTISYANTLDFFLFAGHGEQGYIPLWNKETYFNIYGNRGLNPPLLSFGGTTKWVILDACKTLQLNETGQNPWEFNGCFKGVHSIMGYDSKTFQNEYCRWQYWSFGWKCGDWAELNPLMYETFAQNWIGDGAEIWLAWLNSVQYIIHDVMGKDVVPAVISVFGNVYRNGHWEQWLGAYEKYATMLNKPTPIGNSIVEADYQWVPWYLYRITKRIGTNPEY
jgi:hypothetical protein